MIFPYTISQSDPEIFVLAVSTQHCNCTWTAELYWTAGSKVGHTFIEDNGHPFRETATNRLPTVTWWQNNRGSWCRGGTVPSTGHRCRQRNPFAFQTRDQP